MGNREKLLTAAKKCLFEKGYGQTTVRDIAGEAGVSMAAIGYHFGSKEALLNTALFEALDAGEAATNPESDPGTAADVRALWTGLLESFTRNKTFWMANFEAVLQAQRDPDLRRQLAGGLEQGRSGMARVLTGTPEADLPESVVRSLGAVQLALMSGVMMQWLTDPDSAPDADEILTGLRSLAELAAKPDS